ncbi:PREDICTED: uncharacterized protein LOC105558417 [Vollenhovia emeryi]|uniref:uncharacterized protein LOC105558417 n=1 Tax=Vollenhovia emeryi TaxID=411798 RepID=UPI0005F58D0F|nr:PREDICTED: uncharacterized protein LOC105558417 [Vollenhovia emeryi]
MSTTIGIPIRSCLVIQELRTTEDTRNFETQLQVRNGRDVRYQRTMRRRTAHCQLAARRAAGQPCSANELGPANLLMRKTESEHSSSDFVEERRLSFETGHSTQHWY